MFKNGLKNIRGGALFLRCTAVLVAALLLCATAGLFAPAAQAAVYTKTSGSISVLKLLTDTEMRAGIDVSYKLSVTKTGRVTAVLTDKATGTKTTIFEQYFSAVGSTKITVPGSKLASGKEYTLSVVLDRSNKAIGTAEAGIVIRKAHAEILSLSATASFNPANGGACTVKFEVADTAQVYAAVVDDGGATVATLASGKTMSGQGTLTWNGMDTKKIIAPNGTYTIRVYCVNSAGTSPAKTVPVKVTGTPATIIKGTASGLFQSAFITGMPKEGATALLIMNTKAAGKYTMRLQDASIGRTYTFSGTLKGGVNRFKLYPSYIIAGHKYVWTINGSATGGASGTAKLTFTAYTEAPTLSALNATVYRAGYGMDMPITFTVGGAGRLDMSIYDSKGKKVASVASRMTVVDGPQTLYWNGLDSAGQYLPAGTYTIRARVNNAGGLSKLLTKSFTYENPESDLPTAAVSGSILKFTLLTDPQLPERTPLRVRVQTAEAGTLKIVLKPTPSGSNTVLYNAAVQKGTFELSLPGSAIRARAYTIEATLSVSGKGVVGRGRVSIHPTTAAPQITDFSCSASLDNTSLDNLCLGSVTTTSAGKMYLRIRNEAGVVVRSLMGPKRVYGGTTAFSWDGRLENGSLAPEGVYTFSCAYVDDYNKRSNTATGTVEVKRPVYPEGVYGYAYIGAGTERTIISIYNNPGGNVIGTTYAKSATFNIIQKVGNYVYAEICRDAGAPIRGYVAASQIERVAITSPYRIEVSITRSGANAQKIDLYKDGVLIDSFPISSGLVDGTTPTGTFLIMDRKPSFTTGGLLCEHALRVIGGVCIHRVPLYNGDYTTTTKYLGHPASHGCIRIPVEKSLWMYTNIPDTTPVYVYYG